MKRQENTSARLSRREMLAASAATLHACAWNATAQEEQRKGSHSTAMGVVIHSYGMHSRDPKSGAQFREPLRFLKHCHALGAGGVQLRLGTRSSEEAARIRQFANELGMYCEGIVGMPRDGSDRDRFATELRTARECGASVVRTAMLSGRRYETFDSLEQFQAFKQRAWKSIRLAEPVAAREKIRLAIENHKDWRNEELLHIIREVSSPWVGICVDTGNSIALLEEPVSVARDFAPFAYATHIKDMGVREYADGFLLSEVPLGQGFLELPRIMGVLREAQPDLRFSLEMITRDPLKIPCLTTKYWATFPKLPARILADSLARVRQHAQREPLPRVSHLEAKAKLAEEEANVRHSLQHAREALPA